MAGEAGAHLYAGVLTVDKLDVQKRIISLCRVLTFSFVRKATLNAHLISALRLLLLSSGMKSDSFIVVFHFLFQFFVSFNIYSLCFILSLYLLFFVFGSVCFSLLGWARWARSSALRLSSSRRAEPQRGRREGQGPWASDAAQPSSCRPPRAARGDPSAGRPGNRAPPQSGP